MGAQTMNHCLAKLVLLEQIYRITMIAADKQYHY
ncbi:23S rRNA (pseudouridine(1915)-N(3))-methyltransferase RlmH [Patescibacteria group bacterium]|nr:23S rRNA (pseudouridine(1915)-N(3))-methyltransferase RlmH [Patescibacteria group bacterium]